MSGRKKEYPALGIFIDNDLPQPIYSQVYHQIQNLILGGHIRPGTRLPSTRTIAEDLNCSRTTILRAFDQLAGSGYITGNLGGGTFVSDNVPIESLLKSKSTVARNKNNNLQPQISKRGIALAANESYDFNPELYSGFPPGEPDIAEFPFDTWTRLFRRTWLVPKPNLIYGDDPAGFLPLREAVATHLATYRGVVCEPDDIVITNGAAQALSIITQIMVDHGEQVWAEEPCPPVVPKIYGLADVQAVPVPVDSNGLVVDVGKKLAPKARMAMVTPSHQFPLCVPMSLERRLELLQWARQANAWLVEDDYDSEFQYVGKPLPTIRSFDEGERVFYVGSFSKFLFSAIRMGYIVLPRGLADIFRRCRPSIDLHPPIMIQPVLATFIQEGHLARHIRKMKKIYYKRQQVFIEAANNYLDGLIQIEPNDGGMNLIGNLDKELAKRTTSKAIEQAARERNLFVKSTSWYYQKKAPENQLLFGYTACQDKDIAKLLGMLADILRKEFL